MEDQLEWIEHQLWNSEPDRKFILTCHVYFGVKFEGKLKPQWTDANNYLYRQKFLSILVRYTEKIVIQVTGHDHHADLRFHRGMIPDLLTVSELDSYIQLHQKWKNEPVDDFVFNNMILNPSLTS